MKILKAISSQFTPRTLRFISQKRFSSFLDRAELKWNRIFSPPCTRSRQYSIEPLKLKSVQPVSKEPKTKPIVGYWYLISGALVFGIVILGGVTRLTESGLSIVEWNLIKGMKPPSNEQEWQEEFAKYKQYPEYQLLNRHMQLDEFKRIFYYEWAHRMWGRAIGLAFVIPGIVFASRGYMTKVIQKRSLLVAGMIGTQGLFGWLMVKSGLDEDILKNKDVPRVNHFWLSAHLGSAFLIYCTMIATGLEILTLNKVTSQDPLLKLPGTIRFKKYAMGLAALVFITAISGAWVAGLDAGLIYNEFPFMGDGLVPSDMWAYSTKSAQNQSPMPWYENLAKNPSAVQFNHRVLAITTFTAIHVLWIMSRKRNLPRYTKIAMNSMMGVATIQVSLGIATLLCFVPIPLAAAHQGGSLTLLTVAMWLIHTLRALPK